MENLRWVTCWSLLQLFDGTCADFTTFSYESLVPRRVISWYEHTNSLFIKYSLLKLHEIYSNAVSIKVFRARMANQFNPLHTINTRKRDQMQPVYLKLTVSQRAISFFWSQAQGMEPIAWEYKKNSNYWQV